mgnify:CR=1 FL=1
MEKLKHVFYDKENDLWYIIPIKDEFLTNKKELVYEKKELIFIGDKRQKRQQIEDLIELICMEDGYGKYYWKIISKLIFMN